MTKITGWHVLGGFTLAFSVIIAVNLLLAVNAVRTFPGLEVANSYVASQSFERDRAEQDALGWQVAAWLEGDRLVLQITDGDAPVNPVIESAVFGRATSVARDQTPDFVFNGDTHVASVLAGGGNWNLRVKIRAADGTLFQRRIIVGQAS